MQRLILAAAASPGDLVAARTQMALSLGWHIVIACLGVGFPAFVLLAEWRGIRTGDPVWKLLARFRARALAAGLVAGALALGGIGVLRADAPRLYQGLTGIGALLLAPSLAWLFILFQRRPEVS